MSGGRTRGVRLRAPSAVVGRGARPDALYVAVVLAADGVRFACAVRSCVELVQRLAAYVGERGEHTLWPDHARRLRGLLARGERDAAVELYFGLVGGRWDDERLVTGVVGLDTRPTNGARIDRVLERFGAVETRRDTG